VNDAVSKRGKRGVADKLPEDKKVFNLAQAHYAGRHPGTIFLLAAGYECFDNIIALFQKPVPCPGVRAGSGEIIVAGKRIIKGIKVVFYIPEDYQTKNKP
jgi:hypothetical protein